MRRPVSLRSPWGRWVPFAPVRRSWSIPFAFVSARSRLGWHSRQFIEPGTIVETIVRFDEWRGTLERRLRSGDETPYLEAHLAKYRSLVPSLALLTHLAERSAGGVGLSALDRAIRWAEYLETHARRIYGHAVQSDVAAAKLLLAKLRKGELRDGFTARDVYRPQWSGLTERQAVEDALALLVDHGYLRTHEHPNARKPVATYTINPKCTKAAPPLTDKADIDAPRPIIVSNGSDRPAPFPKHTAPETSDEWEDVV